MFERGQLIIYGGNGVCRIEDIVIRDTPILGQRETYVIRLASGLTAYIPTDSSVYMRALVSEEEALSVIRDFPGILPKVIPASNSKALADQYRAIIAKHDLREMICLYKSLRQKLRQSIESGKKPGTMDERFSTQALDAVLEELCAVLSRERQELLNELLPQEKEPT